MGHKNVRGIRRSGLVSIRSIPPVCGKRLVSMFCLLAVAALSIPRIGVDDIDRRHRDYFRGGPNVGALRLQGFVTTELIPVKT